MKKLNYSFFYMLIFFISLLFFLVLFYVYNQNSKTVHINQISANSFIQKYEERNVYFHQYFEQYKDVLTALEQNKYLQSFVNHHQHKDEVQNLFMTVKQSFKDIRHIRLINMHGFEKINISDNANTQAFIVPTSELQDKSHRYYIADFKSLKKGEIGYSKIDLMHDFNKVINPKIMNIRLGKVLFDQENNKKYMLVVNVDLNRLVKELQKTVLYQVFLVDNRGRFILHHDQDKGMTSQQFKTYLLEDEFDAVVMKDILTHNEYIGKNFYAKKIVSLNTGQELRLILKQKFDKLTKKKQDKDLILLIVLLFLILAAIPVVLYLSKIPDKLKRKINRQYITDSLTQLPNREAFLQDIKKIKTLNSQHIILISVDNYKRISNAYGYEISDELMKKFSQFLLQLVQEECHSKLYITTKNTFAFICDQNRYTQIMLRKAYTQIEEQHFIIQNEMEFLVDISIGVSSFSPILLIDKYQEARVALDVARNEKIDIKFYDDNLNLIVQQRINNLKMSAQVKEAIDEQRIKLLYQPIYNNRTNQIDKFEILMRLEINGKLYGPDTFLEVAKDNKRYNKLTQLVIKKAFKKFALNTYVFSINLSIEDIKNKSLIHFLFEQIEKYNIGSRLVIEIVESDAIDNFNVLIDFIKHIKVYGVRISIDDFGSGYSNYEYIVRLSDYIDYLKVDGSLIVDIHKNRKKQFLVGTLKFLCENLKIDMIAEYNEDKETFEFVKSLGVEYSQGYYIGKPTDSLNCNVKHI